MNLGNWSNAIQTKELSDRFKKVLKIFQNYNFRRILDIGCADGNFSMLLKISTNAEEIYGVDISLKAVELAKKRGVKAFECDINNGPLPFENDSFNAIFCGEVIEHLIDADHLLDEIYRMLKPNGIAVITTPNLAAWYNRIALLFGFQPFWADVSNRYNVGKMLKFGEGGGHLRVFTYRALKELLLLHQFKILKIIASDPLFPRRLPKIARVILYALTKMISFYPPLSSNPIFVISKSSACDTQ